MNNALKWVEIHAQELQADYANDNYPARAVLQANARLLMTPTSVAARKTLESAIGVYRPNTLFCQDCGSLLNQHESACASRLRIEAECKNPMCDLLDVTRDIRSFPLAQDEAERYREVVRMRRIGGQS